jgi:5'-3' exonuclease
MVVHLLDGTYELFRQFYGRRRGGPDRELGAVAGVLHSVLETLEGGATHVGVATDHVIESFRNELWAGYKNGAGVDPALLAQFEPLEEALAAMGVAVWPMVEFEADDALASVAAVAAASREVDQVRIWTPDKDLAQCVRDHRVVQVDRRAGEVRDAEAIKTKFGVEPRRIPDWLALVGDSADGFPGIAGIGKVNAARLIEQYGPLEDFPESVLGQRRELALLFKQIATLRDDLPCIDEAEQLRWRGSTPGFGRWAERTGDDRLLARSAYVTNLLR